MPPPLNVGFVAMEPAGPGGVDLQGQVGAGAEFLLPAAGGVAAVHVEPFVSKTVSIPVGVGIMVGGGPDIDGVGAYSPVRVGVRHRAWRHVAWGAGVGPSVGFGNIWPMAAAVGDLELIAGRSFERLDLSVAIRPAVSFDGRDLAWFGLIEPTLAIPAGPASVTLGVFAGPWFMKDQGGRSLGGFAGGTVGVHRRF